MSEAEKAVAGAELELAAEPAIEPLEAPQTYLPRTFDAFKDRNFRWFFGSLCGNFAAMNMQMFIRGWLVFEITGSYEKLGYMSAAGGIVGLFLAPVGGVIADRVRQKKHVIQFCQSVNTALTLVIGYLIHAGMLQFEHLLIAAVIQGMSMTTMMPARQALPAEIVARNRLMNAIALNTSGMNAARLLIPGFAGFMVGALGGGNGNIDPAKWVYFTMAALYLWSVVALLAIHVEDRKPEGGIDDPILEGLIDGFRYCVQTRLILMLLAVNFLMVFFSMPYFLLLPGFAKQVLGAGPEGLGVLISVSGMGSLAGSLVIASMNDRRRGRILIASGFVMGIGIVLFGASTDYWLSLVILTVIGLGQAGRMSLSNVLIQSYVDDDYRGRVMSIYMLEFSILQISIFPISVLADLIGPQWAVAASGLCLLILVVFLWFRVPQYRDLD